MEKSENIIKSAPLDQAATSEHIASPTNKSRNRGKKRKRCDSDSSTDVEDILPDNTLEVEKNLQNAALRNNLDDASVKKILKKVVTNDHVLALVKLREQEEDAAAGEKQSPQPKLTRAKAKELMRVSSKSAPWNLELTPIKHIPVKTRPEVEALITKELPEDEDDDEYEPTHEDVPSDDDQTLESCSDLDSQPPTPATPRCIPATSPKVLQDGPFKVPLHGISTPARRKLVIVEEEEEATIALRTRSKLSLSATPIEHIESSFVPPDDVPMPIGDDLWNKFLEECLNPAETSRNEDDDETDPEYNVAADPDAHDEEEEGLDCILKISKKELNDLVAELFSIMPEGGGDQLDLTDDVLAGTHATKLPNWEGKQETKSDDEAQVKWHTEKQSIEQKRDSSRRYSIGKSEIEDSNCNEESEGNKTYKENKESSLKTKTVTSEPSKVVNIATEEQDVLVQPMSTEDNPPPILRSLQEQNRNPRELQVNMDATVKIIPEQVLILQQQLRQHVQLATANYLQLYVHPVHWTIAPSYKDYLEQLYKMVESNPKSVANVCNLKSAVELIHCWEKTVSENTEENRAMVEFIQNEVERNRRRFNTNSFYIGNFPEKFMQVVANSTVFLYPYLLPSTPYRADNNRKFGYRRSEDELIALGLDQFWQYVEDNPDMFKKPRNVRGRWGLVATCTLICKHMLPWITPKWLRMHVCRARKIKDNPIAKFFLKRESSRVQHRLLAYNPGMTLYEQPEHEMPRIWVRYLAKCSHRFRNHFYKRTDIGLQPAGVPVTINVTESIKKPLPIDFTKRIVCNRYNVISKTPHEPLHDKFDIHVVTPAVNTVKTGPFLTINPIQTKGGIVNNVNIQKVNVVSTSSVPSGKVAIPKATVATTATKVTSNNATGKLTPISLSRLIPEANIAPPVMKTISETATTQKSAESQNFASPISTMFRVVQTSHGAYLVPLAVVQNTSTVNSITTPITSTTADSMLPNDLPEPSRNLSVEQNLRNHCKCCILLKKICKERQSRITDFFTSERRNKRENSCECTNRKFPRVTERLKMLVDNFKSRSWCEYRRIKSLIDLTSKETNSSKEKDGNQNETGHDEKCSVEDMEYVTAYHIKLTRRLMTSRNVYLKTRIDKMFCNFDPEFDNPLTITEILYKAFDVELVDLYKEFIGFLNPEQAEQIDRFHEYFIYKCFRGLLKRVETEVQDVENRQKILKHLESVFTSKLTSPCDICVGILHTMKQYPRLAKYVFSLFPHRNIKEGDRGEKPKKDQPTPEEKPVPIPQFLIQIEENVENDQINSDKQNKETECSKTIKDLSAGDVVNNIESGEHIEALQDEDDEMSSEANNEQLYEDIPETPLAITNAIQKDDDLIKSEDVLSEDIEISETTVEGSIINKNESHDNEMSESTDMSPLVMSEDELDAQMKTEPPEWKREEDKFILEILLKYVTPEDRQQKTILEILDENNVYQIIADSLSRKSVTIEEVKERVMYILEILVMSEY